VDLEPRKRRPGLGRARIAAGAAVLLLLALLGGTGLLGLRQQQQQAQATASAQTATAAAGGGTASPSASATGSTATAGSSTAVASTAIPIASGTPDVGADMSFPPAPPPGTGASVSPLPDPYPTCDHPAGPSWQKDDQTTVSCAPDGGVRVVAQSASALACIEQHAASSANGYVDVLAGPQSGDPVLGFRLGTVSGGGGTQQVIGYYFRVIPSNDSWVLYRINADGSSHTIQQGALNKPLAAHFALGATYKGGTITLYINGVQIVAPISDATFTQGWMGLCTTGVTTFKFAQMNQYNG